MSRRPHVPMPFQKILPHIIRGAGPRMVVSLAACALLLVGGGSYLLSRATPVPTPNPAPQATVPQETAAPEAGKVLGSSTSQPAPEAGTVSSGTTTGPASTSHSKSGWTDGADTVEHGTSTCSSTCTTPASPPQATLDPLLNTVNNTVVQPVNQAGQFVVRVLGKGWL